MKKTKHAPPPLKALIEEWKDNPATTYTPANILRDHADTILFMLSVIKDVEFLASINAPIMDGSPMHLAIKRVIEKAEGAA